MKNNTYVKVFVVSCLLFYSLLGICFDTIKVGTNFTWLDALPYAEYRLGGTWQQVETATDWTPIKGSEFRLPADSTVWLGLIIQNEHDLDLFFEFYFHSVTISSAKIYAFQNGRVDSTKQTGNLVQLKDRATPQRDLSLLYPIKAGQTVKLYISVYRKGFPQMVTLTIADTRFGDGSRQIDRLIIMILSFCLVVFVLALTAAFALGLVEYAFYATYVFGGTLFLASSYGLLVFLLPKTVWLIDVAPIFFAELGLTGFILFSIRFLDLRQWNKLVNRALHFTPVIAFLVMFLAVLYAQDIVKAPVYGLVVVASAVWITLAFTIIIWVAWWRVRKKKEKEYVWFLAIFANLFVLVLLSIGFETKFLYIGQQPEIVLELVLVSLEVLITLSFLIFYTYQRFEDQKLKAIEAEIKKDRLRQNFSNMLHSNIRGGLSSILQDLNDLKNQELINTQIKNLIEECKLGEVFLEKGQEDLYSLLKSLEFWASPILHNEIKEKYFYAEIDPGLKTLRFAQNELLNVFLHEAVANVKKYSNYSYAKLIANIQTIDDQENINISIVDDGVGLQQTLGITENPLEINSSNFQAYSQRYFKAQSTGLRRLFKLVEDEDDVDLLIRSRRAQGTSYTLVFRIQDSSSEK